MKNLIKKFLFPDEMRLQSLFIKYNVEFVANYPICFNRLIEEMGRDAIHTTSIKELKSIKKDIKFIISAKDFYTRRNLAKNSKMVDLKLSIDKMVEDALK